MPVDSHRAGKRLQHQLGHIRKRRRVTLAAAASVAAAVAVTVVATGAGGWLGADQAGDPAQNPDQAEAIAREFLDADASFDADEAITYLTDDAVARRWGNREQLHQDFAYNRAVGYKQTINGCEQVATRSSG
jgi:hypothetical protein